MQKYLITYHGGEGMPADPEQRQQAIIPAFHPVAVGNKLLYRTHDGICVVDLKNPDKPGWWNYADGGAVSTAGDTAKRCVRPAGAAADRTDDALARLAD